MPDDAVPTLAAASAFLATKNAWRIGPVPIVVFSFLAAVIISCGIFIAAETLVTVTTTATFADTRASWTSTYGYIAVYIMGVFFGVSCTEFAIRLNFRKALRNLMTAGAKPQAEMSGSPE